MSAATQPPAVEAVEAWFAAHPDLPVERIGGQQGWFTVLRGEHKRRIPVYLALGAHTLFVESHFMRAPDEQSGEVWRFLLRRNLRTYVFRFALSDTGDVTLIGVLPRHAVTIEELDRALGQLLEAADSAFAPALRLGFATYIAHEQAWRAKVGAPRNPIS